MIDDIPTDVLLKTRIPKLGGDPWKRGKARDVYRLGDDRLLMVATDRVSAFDVVMGSGIPGKGYILTELSNRWFYSTADIMPNHLIGRPDRAWLKSNGLARHEELLGRSMMVKYLPPLPVEFVYRVCITGSAWEEYERGGGPAKRPHELVSLWGCAAVFGGLTQGAWLRVPIFTPTTKAESGHDLPLSWDAYVEAIGDEGRARELADKGAELTLFMAEYARDRGMILADHKIEIARDSDNQWVLVDELGTPDSSRYWDMEAWKESRFEGKKLPPALDKQYLRDWLNATNFNRQPPGPELPEEVVQNTRDRYVEALRRLTS